MEEQGEVFKLQSPKLEKERRKPQQLVQLEARHDTVTDEWYVTAGVIRGTGESLSMALHDIANKLDAMNAYGSGNVRVKDWVRAKSKPCQYCGASIFFGQTPSGKWIPLDTEPTDASQVTGYRCAVVIDSRNGLQVGFPSRPEGRVWVPHPDTCGINKTVPEARVAKERWLNNRDQVEAQRRLDRQRLLDSTRELTEREAS